MTTLQILSDLHLEFERDKLGFIDALPVTATGLVLAGDLMPLGTPGATGCIARICDKWEWVVYVPGNHEYYGWSPESVACMLLDWDRRFENLHILNPGRHIIDGIRFVGAPLWFPETPDEDRYRGHLSDFRAIRGFEDWVHDEHDYHLRFLRAAITPGCVVVTHHLPHRRSIAEQYVGSNLNRFFLAEDAEPLVETGGAALWVHGHGHSSVSYRINETVVISNPRGYPGENEHVDFGFTVEI